MKKEFDLGTILTVTTDRLLTRPVSENNNGITDLYKILNHMTGGTVYTHTLGRFADTCKSILLELFPELNNVNLKVLDEMLDNIEDHPNFIDEYLEMCIKEWGMLETYDILESIVKDHKVKNPITELNDMMEKLT